MECTVGRGLMDAGSSPSSVMANTLVPWLLLPQSKSPYSWRRDTGHCKWRPPMKSTRVPKYHSPSMDVSSVMSIWEKDSTQVRGRANPGGCGRDSLRQGGVGAERASLRVCVCVTLGYERAFAEDANGCTAGGAGRSLLGGGAVSQECTGCAMACYVRCRKLVCLARSWLCIATRRW